MYRFTGTLRDYSEVEREMGRVLRPCPPEQSLQNVGIDLACVLFFGFFFKRDAEGTALAHIARDVTRRSVNPRFLCCMAS